MCLACSDEVEGDGGVGMEVMVDELRLDLVDLRLGFASG